MTSISKISLYCIILCLEVSESKDHEQSHDENEGMREGRLHLTIGLHIFASQSLSQQELQVANGSHPSEEDEPRRDAVGDAVGEAHGGHSEEGCELVHGVLKVHLLHVGQRVHTHHHLTIHSFIKDEE